jgi:predicted AlkP superfamily phosphohydrolase/phosphomutase
MATAGDRRQERPRCLLIALDALDARRFERFLAAGRLPNLARFCARSSRLAVASEGGVLGGAVWPTFVAGQGPGSHGRYYSVQWLAEEMAHVRTERPEFRYEPFWAALLPEALNTVVFDVPYAPAVDSPSVRTCLGWGLHDEVDAVSIPADFRATIERRHGRGKLTFDTMEPQSDNDRVRMVRDLRDSAMRRSRILLDLARDPWWDLCIFNFSEVHKAGHYLSAPRLLAPGMDNEDALAAVMAPLDAILPAVIDAAGTGTSVFLFSLHGTTQQVDYSGFGPALASVFAGRPAANPEDRRDLLRQIRDLLPDALHRRIWHHLPGRFRAARTGQRLHALANLASDSFIPIVHDHNAALRLNLRGRERDGVVAPEKAVIRLDEFEAFAMRFVAENGLPAFSRLARPQEEYPGPKAHRLPDALLVANPGVRQTRTLTAAAQPTLTSNRAEVRDGVHTSEGFCYLHSPAVPRIASDSVRSVDFAPTVLDLLGIAPLANLEGRSFAV